MRFGACTESRFSAGSIARNAAAGGLIVAQPRYFLRSEIGAKGHRSIISVRRRVEVEFSEMGLRRRNQQSPDQSIAAS
jgi:transposase InsO family protein